MDEVGRSWRAGGNSDETYSEENYPLLFTTIDFKISDGNPNPRARYFKISYSRTWIVDPFPLPPGSFLTGRIYRENRFPMEGLEPGDEKERCLYSLPAAFMKPHGAHASGHRR